MPRLLIALALVVCLISSKPASALPREKESWIEVTTPNFTIYSNSSKRNTVRIANDFERFHAVLGQLTGIRINSPVPTHVYVFSDSDRFTPYKPLRDGRPKAVGGYFRSRRHGNVIALNGDPARDPTDTVYHEYVHYFLSSNFPAVPTWFNEGLAEFYSSFVVSRKGAEIGRALIEHVSWLGKNRLIPLSKLFAVDHDSPEYNEKSRRGIFYAQSWSLVHYLLLGNKERKGQVSRYLDLSIEGVNQDEAFTRAFATDYEQLEQELRKYLRGTSMPYLIAKIKPPEESSFQHRSMAYPEALVQLGNLLADAKDREEDASEHFNLALQNDPGNAHALAGLGYLASRHARYPKALDFFSQALKTSKDDFLIQYRFAECLLKSESAKVESRKEAQAALGQSIRLNPKYAPAWALLAYAFTFENEPSDEALRVAKIAHKMLPSRIDVANNLASIQVRRGEQDAALKMLEALRLRVASATDRAFVDRNLKRLNLNGRYKQAYHLFTRGNAAEAQVILEALIAENPDSKGGKARRLLDQITKKTRQQQIQAEIDRSNELLDLDKPAEALQVLEKIEAPEGSSKKRWIDGQMVQIRALLDHSRFAVPYNKARARFDARDFKGACKILEELMATFPKGSRNYGQARQLWAHARAELRYQE